MAQDQFKRKLTTIFSADVAGYSRLMSEDEAATVKTLEHHKAIMAELTRQHRGHVVDAPGDNLLAEFTSVLAIVTDTVGFIRDLPPQLVAAFRATLEELREADVFLHVVDASGEVDRRIAAVRGVLEDMGLGGVPEVLVFNKIYRLPPGEGARLAHTYGAVPVSARAATGLAALLESLDERIADTGRWSALAPDQPAVFHASGRG